MRTQAPPRPTPASSGLNHRIAMPISSDVESSQPTKMAESRTSDLTPLSKDIQELFTLKPNNFFERIWKRCFDNKPLIPGTSLYRHTLETTTESQVVITRSGSVTSPYWEIRWRTSDQANWSWLSFNQAMVNKFNAPVEQFFASSYARQMSIEEWCEKAFEIIGYAK